MDIQYGSGEFVADQSNVQKMEDMLMVSVPPSLMDSQVMVLRQKVLKGIRLHRSRWVLLDFSQVEICDSFFGRFIHNITEAARLMGAEVIVAGLQEAVAETLVEFGFYMPGVHAALDVDDALAFSRAARRNAVQRGMDTDGFEQAMLSWDEKNDPDDLLDSMNSSTAKPPSMEDEDDRP